MNDTRDLLTVSEVLEAAGLRIHRIEEAQTRRCDLAASDDGEEYLIEVKGLHDDRDIGVKLRTQNQYDGKRPLVRSSTAEAVIEDAVKQLRETRNDLTSESSLLIIALVVRSRYGADVTLRQILGTLYGIQYIVYHGASGGYESRECLYFTHSAFFRHRHDLDGVLVIDGVGARFCLNDYRRAQRVRSSRLGRFFGAEGALTDAERAEELGFLVADCDLDRKDERAMLGYIGKKYNLRNPISCSPTEYSCMVSVPSPVPTRPAIRPKPDEIE